MSDAERSEPSGAPRALVLSRLELRHFRSHQAFARAFDARPVCLFGPNGAGKTNILEAISLLSPGRGLRGAAAEEMARRPNAIGWAVRADAETLDGPRRLSVAVDLRSGAKRRVDVDESQESQSVLGRLLRILWLTPAMDRLWIEGPGERRKFLDRTTLAFDPAHAERSAAYERAMRERNRLLKDDAPPPAWLDALETRMADAGVDIVFARAAAAKRLQIAQNSAKTLFPKAEIAISGDIENALRVDETAGDLSSHRDIEQENFARILRENRRKDSAAGRTLIGPHRSDLDAVFAAKGVEARYCSTGEQKALLISLVLGTARALAEDLGAAPLILLDEVAAHLDAGRRAALYDEICALGSQAWLTGTGPELFAELGERAQRIELGGAPDSVAP